MTPPPAPDPPAGPGPGREWLRIGSDRRWTLPAGQPAVWAALADVDRYRSWWPWLVAFQADALEEGAVWRCRISPPTPYVLRFALTLVRVVPLATVEATVAGDIVGTATLELSAGEPGTTELRLVSDLAPGSPVLRAVSVVARPLARFGHDWVLDTGVRQFGERALAGAGAAAGALAGAGAGAGAAAGAAPGAAAERRIPDTLGPPKAERLNPARPDYAAIMEAHRAAAEAGRSGYVDPGSGFFVLTAPALAARGSCCGLGCRHCPFPLRAAGGGQTLPPGLDDG